MKPSGSANSQCTWTEWIQEWLI